MKSKAQELLAVSGKAAAASFRKDGWVIPELLMENADGFRLLIGVAGGLGDSREKDKTADMLRKAIRDFGAVRYALEMEAWTVDPSGDTETAMEMQAHGESLKDHPDRIEVVSIFVEDKITGEHLMRYYRILRPEHGKPTLAPPKDLETEGGYGRFQNLFEDEKDE